MNFMEFENHLRKFCARVKKICFGIRLLNRIPRSVLYYCVILGKLLNFSETWFLHLYKE